MSLSDRLANIPQRRSNQGCVTCKWVDALSTADRRAFDAWIIDGKSISQLWEACANDDDNPLRLSSSPFRDHIRHHEPLA